MRYLVNLVWEQEGQIELEAESPDDAERRALEPGAGKVRWTATGVSASWVWPLEQTGG